MFRKIFRSFFDFFLSLSFFDFFLNLSFFDFFLNLNLTLTVISSGFCFPLLLLCFFFPFFIFYSFLFENTTICRKFISSWNVSEERFVLIWKLWILSYVALYYLIRRKREIWKQSWADTDKVKYGYIFLRFCDILITKGSI